MLEYEGSGIWSRFNIMFTVNIFLFGIASFIFSSQPPYWAYFIIGLGVLGILLSLWSIYVLRKLWLWHYYWRSVLTKIEINFPKKLTYPRPFSDIPSNLKKKHRWYQTLLLAYTQPFFLILCIIWFFLILLASFYILHNGTIYTI